MSKSLPNAWGLVHATFAACSCDTWGQRRLRWRRRAASTLRRTCESAFLARAANLRIHPVNKQIESEAD